MSIAEKINQKGISEVLHFTLDNNLIGIVANGCLLSRVELDKKALNYQSLEFVNDIIWTDRNRDAEWTDHINLSIDSVNQFLLDRARANNLNHKWFILSFDPEILTHDEVYFTTTNNAYVPHVRRNKGCEGFELPFTETYKDRLGYMHSRKPRLEANFPTSQQAEVLYPKRLTLEKVLKIYVENEDGFLHATTAISSCSFLPDCPPLTNIEIQINPLKFKSNTNQEVY